MPLRCRLITFILNIVVVLIHSVWAKELIVTWGGNRISSQTQDPNYYEPSLESVCTKSNYASAVHIMGVLQFYGPNNQIGMGLANHCNRVFPGFNRPSSGYTVLSCPAIAAQIKKCQSLGKRVLISLGK
jgi:chitinase